MNREDLRFVVLHWYEEKYKDNNSNKKEFKCGNSWLQRFMYENNMKLGVANIHQLITIW
jgi:hypothetical protein